MSCSVPAGKRVAIAGTGTRALCFAKGILHRVSEYSQLVALYDLNPQRIKGFKYLLKNESIPEYTDFEAMVKEARPTHLLVCVPDCAHPQLIEMGFSHGLEVVTEKPMAMNREGIRRILQAERKYGKKVCVTFNMRFSPYSEAIRKLMLDHPIGKITNVTAEWFLDRTHGQEYFHRWHAKMSNGGGLLVHKATHHFDLLNWFLDDEPESVYATGARKVFGDANPFFGERCSNCPHANKCWAVLKSTLEDGDLNPGSDGEIFEKLYFEAEKLDGYHRDGCCFARDIDIYDTMNAVIRYKSGVMVNYSENAYSPWQGYNVVFNGDAGRIEVGTVDASTRPGNFRGEDYIRILHGTTRQNITMEELPFREVMSPHGGGDYALYDQIFGKGGADPLGLMADSRAGAASALVGITANESIASGKVEKIGLAELF